MGQIRIRRQGKPGDKDGMDDIDLAAALAETAGAMLHTLAERGRWLDAALATVGDRLSNELILAGLRWYRPDDAILSEESEDDPSRLGQSRVWIVDPLDGSCEYGEGRDDWAVQVGLAIDGRAVLGAIAVPAHGLLLRSDRPPSLPWCHEQTKILVSRSHPPAGIAELARALDAVLVPMGSVGAKLAALLDGRADAYVHYGGQFEWDNCAPAAIAAAAGLDVSRLSGAPLAYNQLDPSLPDIVISHPLVTDALRIALVAARRKSDPAIAP